MTKSTKEYYLKYDLFRYFYPDEQTNQISLIAKVKKILLTQAIWAILVYRAGSWCVRNSNKFGFVIKLILPFLTFFQKISEITTGIEIPFTAKIGRGLYIGHFGQIIISPHVVIGEFCNLSQGVTIGQAGRGEIQHAPVIGDRVYIAPGAKVFGKVTVGNDVAIGANAVVIKDLPDNAVAVGVPARIANFNSSREFVNFNRRWMGLE